MAFTFPQQQQPSIFQTPSQQQQPSIFQTPSQQQQPFQFQPSTPNPFQPQQQTPQQSIFQFQPPPQQPSLFQVQQQLVPQQQQQQQILLYTVDKTPASYSTKWGDLHPDSQKYLLMIEEKILEYRAESQALDQCSRLYDSSVANCGFEVDATRIVQELGGITTTMDRERIFIQERMAAINSMMRDTEVAVRSFMMLRQRFIHRTVGANQTGISASQSGGATTTPALNTQPLASSLPVFDFYSGLPRRPSSFMQNTVSRFERYLTECHQWIGELEQMLNLAVDGKVSNGVSSLQSLPGVMTNLHDYFVHVAAKVENLHQRVESMKIAYLSDQRRGGDWNDPFLEADRREIAKQEAAARRVHPTLHLPPPVSQPTTQSVGLAASSSVVGSANAPQLPSGASGASSASNFPIFSNPSSSAQPSSLFSTPATSSLFGSSGPSPLSTPFASALAPMAGSSQPSSLFSSGTTLFASPGFGSSPAFSTPSFASGAATGSGYSFSGANPTKPSKPKSRTSRR